MHIVTFVTSNSLAMDVAESVDLALGELGDGQAQILCGDNLSGQEVYPTEVILLAVNHCLRLHQT